jgi:cobaltochelatase CobN
VKEISSKIRNSIALLTLTVIFVLAISGTASADPYVGGQNLTTVKNGTVSGGLYEDTYYGFNNSETPANVTYNFKSLPSNAQVKSATLYTGVYSGHMQEPKDTYVKITFNGQNIANEFLTSTYTYPMGIGVSRALIMNDHCNRVTSDYFMWYDVTGLVRQNNKVNIDTAGSFDGRIKHITLVIAYDDGDSDIIRYWVNVGHDADNYYTDDELGIDYVGRTNFVSALPSGSTVQNATLKVIHMASADGSYTFNGNVVPNRMLRASFSGSNTWNVLNYFQSYGVNTLTYDRGGSYYKIAIALLTVKYTEPAVPKPDLIISSFNPPSAPVVNQKHAVSVNIKNNGLSSAGNFAVKLYDGSKEVATKTISSLGAGASTAVNFNWTPTTTGSHTLKVMVDALKQVTESDENNNQLNKTVTVEKQKADLIISSFTLPNNPKLKKTYQLKAVIKNNGLVNAGTFTTKFYDGSTLLGSFNTKSLAVGKSTSFTLNWTPKVTGSHKLKMVVDTAKQVDESNENNNQLTKNAIIKKGITVFMVSDSSGINVLNTAAKDILKEMGDKVDIVLRNGRQIEAMSVDELRSYLEACDIFMGNWITTDGAAIFSKVLSKYPEVANKKNGLFLVLEPPVSTTGSSISLIKYSNFKGDKILNGFTDAKLLDYYQNTLRGTTYTNATNYLNSVNFPTVFETGTLYKILQDKDNQKNQILWALNLTGFDVTYKKPTFTSESKEYGIYRYRWYTLNDYKKAYVKSNRQGTVGLIESTMYITSQKLQTYYAIVDSLEAKNLNVLPVFAAGATPNQLQIMVETFTSAPNFDSFIANPSKYKVYVDSIVEMTAYGVGGSEFGNVTKFFSALNVPVVRAIHSDVMTNEEWELANTGLPTDDGSKWWHVAILEAQGIIEYSFVGGTSVKIDPDTGAQIEGYTPQTENIEFMNKRIASWVNLQNMKNSDKLISLIYYNYPPGKNNVGSSYLDTITSIYNLLKILKNAGYTVKDLPASEDDLLDMIIGDQEKGILPLGINVANWAQGELDKLASNPNIILYPVSQYNKWFSKLDKMTQLQVTEGPVAYIGEICKQAVKLKYTTEMATKIDNWYASVIALVPDDKYSKANPILKNIANSLKNYIKSGKSADYDSYLKYKNQFFKLNISGMNGWGKAPGNVMVVKKNGIDYFVIPGIKFGNVFIGPEPQRGWEGNINALYHSTAVAPPHQYLAYFAYLQEQGTDAMVYLGRHATHEWLPGKELVLSPKDLPSVMVGTVPQVYFYITDGLAEGLQAKRRGYAVIISHLTPPMTFTSLYGDLGNLATLVDDYDSATSAERTNIIKQIKSIIQKNHYDVGVNTAKVKDAVLIEALDDYLEDLQGTLYPYGLHAIGQKWSAEQIALLVTSILSVEFEVGNSTEYTTLHDEISQILYKKSYSKLSVIQKENVQLKCIDVVKKLISKDVDTVAKSLTSKPSTKLKYALKMAKYYISAINQSVKNEVSSFLNALNGGFVVPGPGGDPVAYPAVLPTGTNFFDDQASELPTKAAAEYGKILTLLLLEDITQNTEKIAMGIWCVETARDQGALVSVVLHLLGMYPEWSDSPSAGVGGQKLKEMPVYIPLDDLVRPDGWVNKRIDVVVITSGLFRDLYSRQAQLLDNAFRVALARSYYTIINDPTLKKKYGSKLTAALNPIMKGIGYYGAGYESLSQNYVAKHWVEDFAYYLSEKMSPELAGEMAITRIFAPPEGDYGAGISKAISNSWTWEDRMELGEFFVERMGNMYSHKNWGTSNPLVFQRALTGIDTVFTSRNTNLYGVMDNDDFFDYWGGLSMALEYVNGKAPNMYVLDYSNRANPDSITIEKFINRELITRSYNPDWIKGMMNYGYDGARYMSKFFSNFLGWQMTRPGSIQNWMWDKLVDIYLKDSYNMGLTEWLMSGDNNFALISITGTLLTAAYEGYWTTDQATLEMITKVWSDAILKSGVACCDCSCGNIAMMKWATQYINPDMLAQLEAVFYDATKSEEFAPNSNPTQGGQQGQSGESTGQGSSAQGTSPGEQASSASSPGSEAGEQKAYEVSEMGQQSQSQNTGMPIAATIGVILLVGLVAVGYFRGRIR